MRKFYIVFFIALLIVVLWVLASTVLLPGLGRFLIKNDLPPHADAVVVLLGGVDYYPRLMEAAALYEKGVADRIVINGNRKNDALRELEKKGFAPCCPWFEDDVRILEILGVPREKVLTISAEDAFDTITEAQAVGPVLIKNNLRNIIIATSKFHTRRACHIWKYLYGDVMQISAAAAEKDEYDPDNWWHDSQQIRWVIYEYGSWIYYFWQITFPGTANP